MTLARPAGTMELDKVDGERISLRLEPEDLELIDEFVDQHPEFSNRSHLARMAIRAFIEKDGVAVSKPSGNRVTVTLSGRQKEVLEQLVTQGDILSMEYAIQDAIQKIYMTKRMTEAIDEAHEEVKTKLGRM
jgi:Arc/MetJ-type ribon-helix-helix transcriptional regulator